MRAWWRWVMLVSVVVLGCSEPTDPQPDAGPSNDSGGLLDTGELSDAASLPDTTTGEGDVGEPSSGDASSGDVTPPLAQTGLTVAFEAGTRTITRAVYGVTYPGDDDQPPTLYLEAFEGGFDGCPQDGSPTPDRSLLVNGLELTPGGGLRIRESGLVAVFFDYEGALTGDAPFVRSTSASATNLERLSDLVRFELDAQFEQGRITGTIAAHHCPGLDE
jgi:hypothetical protein